MNDLPPFELSVLQAARALAASGDHRIILPVDSALVRKKPNEIKIGFFGNIANNAYIFVKCLRKLGYCAELVLEDGCFDSFLLNRPFWEEIEVEATSYEDGLEYEHGWQQQQFVRRVGYDAGMQERYHGRYGAADEVRKVFRKTFSDDLPLDSALLLAQNMGHWPYISAMSRYDVCQFSGAPISLCPFLRKPYFVLPTGSDLTISPFQETLFGLLVRAGYTSACHILINTKNLNNYIERLGLVEKICKIELLMDADCYDEVMGEEAIRANWLRSVGGSVFLLSVCRQDWRWKGNDIALRAFAAARDSELRLVLMRWGVDVEKSERLIHDLGIANKVIWEPLSSKPLLRKKQRACDAVLDQFVMNDTGTSVMESLASGRPVIMGFQPQDSENVVGVERPPVIYAKTEDEITDAFLRVRDVTWRAAVGARSREWIMEHRDYRKCAARYINAIETGLGRQFPVEG